MKEIPVAQKEMMRKMDRKLLSAIRSRTNLKPDVVQKMQIESLEKDLDIKFSLPQAYFEWEKTSEKDGYRNREFVSDREYEARNKRVAAEMKRYGYRF